MQEVVKSRASRGKFQMVEDALNISCEFEQGLRPSLAKASESMKMKPEMQRFCSIVFENFPASAIARLI